MINRTVFALKKYNGHTTNYRGKRLMKQRMSWEVLFLGLAWGNLKVYLCYSNKITNNM